MAAMRQVSGVVLLVACLVSAAASAADMPWTGLSFRAFRNGKPIGTHRVTFHEEHGDLIAETDVDLDVFFAFIKVYSYTHHSREVWRNDRLVALDSQTNDNGKKYTVTGRAVADGFQVSGVDGVHVAPATIIPTDYWHPATPLQTQFVDTAKGRIMNVAPEPQGDGHVRIPSKTKLDLWYDEAGCLQRLSFLPSKDPSSPITYAPMLVEAAPPVKVTAATGLRAVVEQCYPPRAAKPTTVAADKGQSGTLQR